MVETCKPEEEVAGICICKVLVVESSALVEMVEVVICSDKEEKVVVGTS